MFAGGGNDTRFDRRGVVKRISAECAFVDERGAVGML
jgi:hypothetical protein